MEKEKMYTFIGATYYKVSDETYVQAKTVMEAYNKICYNLYLGKPDILACRLLDIDVDLPENEETRKTMLQNLENKRKLIELLADTHTVVTHYGDDLDNKASIEALRRLAVRLEIINENESLNIERVPAGKIKEGFLNVDTGGHTGNKLENNTIVIDGDPRNGVKSACQSLYNLDVFIPKQIRELADTRPTHINALDSRTGLALARYLSGEQVFKLAEKNLLDKSLTDEELEEYGLTEAHLKQQQIIDKAVEKINEFKFTLPSGEEIVLASEQIVGGSSVAYEMGIPYYASTSQHRDKEGNPDGVTFAISCKPGMKLPEEILEYGKQLVEKYRIDEKTSGVFVNPNGQLIVAGGPKNPEFKIEGHTPETMLEELKTVIVPNMDNTYANKIVEAAKMKVNLEEKNEKATKLMQDYEAQLPKNNSSIEER